MKFAGKNFSFYWGIIKIPVAILVLWSIVGFIAAKFYYATYKSTFSGSAGLIISVLVFAFVGMCTARDCKGTVKQAAWAGALTGIIAGFVGAIVGWLTITFVPQLVEDAVAMAVQSKASEAIVRSFITLSTYLGFITGPLFDGLIGAGVAALSAFIACKIR